MRAAADGPHEPLPAGGIRFEGEDLIAQPPHAVAALGMTLLLTRTLPTGRLPAPAAVPAHTLADAGPTHT